VRKRGRGAHERALDRYRLTPEARAFLHGADVVGRVLSIVGEKESLLCLRELYVLAASLPVTPSSRSLGVVLSDRLLPLSSREILTKKGSKLDALPMLSDLVRRGQRRLSSEGIQEAIQARNKSLRCLGLCLRCGGPSEDAELCEACRTRSPW